LEEKILDNINYAIYTFLTYKREITEDPEIILIPL